MPEIAQDNFPSEYPFKPYEDIKGATVQGVESFYGAIKNKTEKDWQARAGCMTFPDAVAKVLKSKGMDTAKWLMDSRKISFPEMRKAVVGFGIGDVYFDWDAACSVNSYYRMNGSTESCLHRKCHCLRIIR